MLAVNMLQGLSHIRIQYSLCSWGRSSPSWPLTTTLTAQPHAEKQQVEMAKDDVFEHFDIAVRFGIGSCCLRSGLGPDFGPSAPCEAWLGLQTWQQRRSTAGWHNSICTPMPTWLQVACVYSTEMLNPCRGWLAGYKIQHPAREQASSLSVPSRSGPTLYLLAHVTGGPAPGCS